MAALAMARSGDLLTRDLSFGPERYAVGLLALALAGSIGIGVGLPASSGVGLLALLGTVMVTAWLGGVGPGVATSVAATAATGVSWLPNVGGAMPPHATAALLLFLVECTAVTILVAQLRARRTPRVAAEGRTQDGVAEAATVAPAVEGVQAEVGPLDRLGLTLAGHLDLETLVHAVTGAGVAATGAAFGAFVYRDASGGLTHCVCGAPKEAFVGCAPIEDPRAFGSPLVGNSTRSDDLDCDPRFGANTPFKQMPLGLLPARSFLAAPVLSGSGELLGGLFFGHPDPAVFRGHHERLIASLAAHAAIAVDNAHLYREAQEARTAAEAASRVKDEFLATLSHELRTPLTAIVGWAYLLQRGRLGKDEIRTAIDTIIRNAHAQNQIVDELLDVSRIVTGKLRLDLQPVEIGGIVKAAIETLTPTANVKSVSVQLVEDQAGTAVMGDPERLQQVFWNLLSNAVKFTPRDGHIKVSIRSIEARVEVSVADTGVGIEAIFLPHVFNRFSQRDSSSTRAVRGLGLGLAIAKQLVELHGGTIEARSPGAGQGSTFTVKFPRSPSTTAPLRGRVYSQAERGAQLEEAPDLTGIRVLIVEDDDDARALIERVLEEQGASVRAVSSATEALAALGEDQIHVLLSDIEMPGTDGYQLIKELRLRPSGQGGSVPAAALTAYARTEDRLRALRAGFELHLSKPLQPAELITVVASLASRRSR